MVKLERKKRLTCGYIKWFYNGIKPCSRPLFASSVFFSFWKKFISFSRPYFLFDHFSLPLRKFNRIVNRSQLPWVICSKYFQEILLRNSVTFCCNIITVWSFVDPRRNRVLYWSLYVRGALKYCLKREKHGFQRLRLVHCWDWKAIIVHRRWKL